MMGIESIKQINRERAAAAAEEGMTPFVYFTPEEVHESASFPFPFIGDYRPEGWTLTDEHFVDSSGFGAENEPALTADQFRALVVDRMEEADTEVGWAVIEAGQFQVYVGEFHPDPVRDQ